MDRLEKRNFADPDNRVPFLDLGGVDELAIAGGVVRRLTYEPGWRWSMQVGRYTGDARCSAHHVGVVLSGHHAIATADGQEAVFGPGDVFHIPPGHDGWTVGDEPCVVVDFGGVAADVVGQYPAVGQLPWAGAAAAASD